jgi:hypothetical protein
MTSILLFLWLAVAAIIGYGAAFFLAFFVLDDPKLRNPLVYGSYIIAWLVIGSIFSIIIALTIPALMLFGVVVFIFEQIQKSIY